MDDELTPEQRFAAEDAATLVPRALIAGRKPEDIVADLVKLDWSPAAAKAFVDGVIADMRQFRESPESRRRLIDAAFKQFLGGSLITLLGIGIAAITLLTMMGGLVMVSGYGFAFVVFFGGLLSAGRGWSRWRFYSGWQQNLDRDRKRNTEATRPSDAHSN